MTRLPLALHGIGLMLLSATAAFAQTPPGAPPDSILRVSGVFRAGARHDLVIAPLRTGSGWLLLLSDTQSDAMRFLTRAEAGGFTTGTEMARPKPVEWTLRFSHGSELVIDTRNSRYRLKLLS